MDITCIGELLIDFSPVSPGVYKENLGGAPANLSIVASRTGAETAFVGVVGNDLFGHRLAREMAGNSVDVSRLYFTDKACTTLAFVSLDESGERSFQFVRNPGADMLLDPDVIDTVWLSHSRIVHFGSAQLMCPEAVEAIDKAVAAAEMNNQLISFDPNYRSTQWQDENLAKKMIRKYLFCADLIKLSEEELYWLTGIDELEQAVQTLARKEGSLLVISCGKSGAAFQWKGQLCTVPGVQATSVDTTGAGDAFWALTLSKLCKAMSGDVCFGELSSGTILDAVMHGNIAGSICVESKGAVPDTLNKENIQQKFLQYYKNK